MQQIGGTGSPIKRVLWTFVAACIAVALWGNAVGGINNILPTMTAKSKQLEKAANGWVDQVGLTKDGTEPRLDLPKPTKSAKPAKKPAPTTK